MGTLRCNVCLDSREDVVLQTYSIHTEYIKDIAKDDTLTVCIYCKKMAQNVEEFINKLESVKALLKLSTNNTNQLNLMGCRLTVSSMLLLECCADEENHEDKYTIFSNCMKPEVKMEMESDIMDNYLSADYDLHAEDVKEEKPSLEDNDEEVQIVKTAVKIQRRSRRGLKMDANVVIEKKLSLLRNVTKRVEVVYLTDVESMAERRTLAAEERYLKARFKCENCVKGYAHMDTYEKHMSLHRREAGDFICNICKQRTKTNDQLQSHLGVHFKRYRCTECRLIRSCRNTITEHYMTDHSDYADRFLCPHCLKAFTKRSLLRKHMSVHTAKDRVVCDYCKKSYVGKNALRLHLINKHSTNTTPIRKDHVCLLCGKAFQSPSQLNVHKLTHSDRKDYYCVECDRKFKSSTSLNQHLKSTAIHVDVKDLNLSCSHCQKSFVSKRSRDAHVNTIHLNVWPYPCGHCDKAYASSWSLKKHVSLSHDGFKRPLKYPCTICDKVFNLNSILKSHMRTHTGERPYQCGKCDARFTQAGILSTHIKLIHLNLKRDGKPKPERKFKA